MAAIKWERHQKSAKLSLSGEAQWRGINRKRALGTATPHPMCHPTAEADKEDVGPGLPLLY